GLRGVLLAREEFLRESLVLRLRSTPGPGPLDRTGFDIPAPDAEESLRARGHEPVVSGLQESSERRWRARPEALVRGHRRPSQRKRDAMGEVDRVDLAVIDRPFRFIDRADVLLRLEGFDRVRLGRAGEVVRNWRRRVRD